MAAVSTLEASLQFLQGLKPPGASPAKIQEITALCIENVQAESSLIPTIFTQFKKAPNTHKLGVLYVVDSVTRQWMSKAAQSGQKLVGATAPQGTFASGVHKMTEILPLMMNELLSDYPTNQKEKIKKLIDIWDHGNTFPKPTLTAFRERLDPSAAAPPPSIPLAIPSTNAPPPPGSAADAAPRQQIPAAPIPDTNSIIAALSSLGKQGGPDLSSNQQSAIPNPTTVPNFPFAPLPDPRNAVPPAQAYAANNYNPGNAHSGLANYGAASVQPPPLGVNGNINPAPVVPAQQPGQADVANNPLLMQVVQAMMAGQITQEQATQLLQQLQTMGMVIPPVAPPQAPAQAPHTAVAVDSRAPNNYANPHEQNDQNGYSSSREFDQRYRSRSPDLGGRPASSPRNRRESPTYGTYDPGQAANGSGRGRQAESDRGGRGRGKNRNRNNDYRQRSPPNQKRQAGSTSDSGRQFPHNVESDPSLPQGSIKVYSRTLFCGGVTASEDELRAVFSQFGAVQTCVVNRDKRHAFVKMYQRKDAVTAKKGMENLQDPDILDKVRSTRWGVGFGPRECSDYTNGVSVIPIDTLTDADRKWVVTAENGGTGGRNIESGLVIEEPDIEIGAGVSSKAISRRMGPDHGSARGRGGHFGGNRGNNNNHGRGRNRDKQERQDRQQERQQHQVRPDARRPPSPRPEPNTVGVPPPVPGFGFQLPGLPMNFG